MTNVCESTYFILLLTSHKMSPNLFFPVHFVLLNMSVCYWESTSIVHISSTFDQCFCTSLHQLRLQLLITSKFLHNQFFHNIILIRIPVRIVNIPATFDPILLAAPGLTVYLSLAALTTSFM